LDGILELQPRCGPNSRLIRPWRSTVEKTRKEAEEKAQREIVKVEEARLANKSRKEIIKKMEARLREAGARTELARKAVELKAQEACLAKGGTSAGKISTDGNMSGRLSLDWWISMCYRFTTETKIAPGNSLFCIFYCSTERKVNRDAA